MWTTNFTFDKPINKIEKEMIEYLNISLNFDRHVFRQPIDWLT